MIHRFKASAFWRIAALALSLALVFSLAACSSTEETTDPEATVTEPVVEATKLVLASTTSTQDSGLFDVLIPAFEEAYPEYAVDVVAVGTGEALALGESKDADVLLVHAKASEEEFVANGFGTERHDVMYNDFIIVGPESDPAGIAGMTDAAAALTKISEAEATFVSRGDDSGTHTKELSIWAAADIEPAGDWYLSAGQGMGDVLKLADEKLGYTMSDRATYLNLMDTMDLVILAEGDAIMFNQYGVIPVVDATNMEGAQAFADWIVSAEGQAVIETYGVEKFGQPLFIPNAS
ncbi:MAG: extracellular solute-binding protein [Coriobacteriia bacterium]|nr:extracellular solute-binding protein [Coriobacteriia bacterium]MBN2821996.1 extracellular solute-binding protein [Coriobacteriia bacterium]